jgi:hypothetical protein
MEYPVEDTILYLYKSTFTKLPEWTEVFVARKVGNSMVRIIANGFWIESELDNENYTFIVSPNLPIKFIPDAHEINLTKIYKDISEDLEEKHTLDLEHARVRVEKYTEEAIDNMLRTKNIVFECRDDSWQMVQWKITETGFGFQAALTYPVINTLIRVQMKL